MKTITDFSPLELTPELNVGSRSVNIQPDVSDVQNGFTVKPSGNSVVGVSVYNSDSEVDYSFVNLAVNPQIPDTLLISSRQVGDGQLISKIESLLPFNNTNMTGVTQIETEHGNVPLNEVYCIQKEPTGHIDRIQTAISFTELTREFKIQPTGDSFSFYIHGVKFTKKTAQTLIIPDVEGLHHIYFDQNGNLQTTTIFSMEMVVDRAYTAAVYWNYDDKKVIYFADERHEAKMPGVVHYYLHLTFGAQYRDGFSFNNIIADGSGDLNSSASFSVSGGHFDDEDIQHHILDGSPQTLSPIAQIPVFYRIDTGKWRKHVANNYPICMGAIRPSINLNTAGVWSQLELGNNTYFLSHIFVTNDVYNPIIAMQGTAQYGNVTAARLAAATEIAGITGLPFQEFVALGTIIYQTVTSYTNDVKARIRSTESGDSYVDWRTTAMLASPSATHNDLIGLQGGLPGDYYHFTLAEHTALLNLLSSSSSQHIQHIVVPYWDTIVDSIDVIGVLECPIAGTITKIRAKTYTGTCTVDFKKNGISIGTVNATSSGVDNTSLSNNICAQYDDLTFDISSSSGTGLNVIVTIQG